MVYEQTVKTETYTPVYGISVLIEYDGISRKIYIKMNNK